MAQKQLTIKIDEQLRKQGRLAIMKHGLTLSEGVRMFLQEVVDGNIPDYLK